MVRGHHVGYIFDLKNAYEVHSRDNMIILKRRLRKQVGDGEGISIAHVRNGWMLSSYTLITIHVQKAGDFLTRRQPSAAEGKSCIEFVC
jgi:hypothetical protein